MNQRNPLDTKLVQIPLKSAVVFPQLRHDKMLAFSMHEVYGIQFLKV